MEQQMNKEALAATVKALMQYGKGLLAMDESTTTCNKRFAALGIPQTEEARRSYRELIITTPALANSISGAILYDETIRQHTKNGASFIDVLAEAGIIPGIKVDVGAKNMAGFPNEKITEGLDGLRLRLKEYAALGARFAKWRAVITIAGGMPTDGCIDANVHALARYAALCQEAGLAPITEPEVLMAGAHSLQRCAEVTQKVLRALFNQLYIQRVSLEGMILKCNMILPGSAYPVQETLEEVADTTVTCLLRVVPAAVARELAAARLNAMKVKFKTKLPWPLTFSFSRAIQQPALEAWKGDEANIEKAQQILLHWAASDAAARSGSYIAQVPVSSR